MKTILSKLKRYLIRLRERICTHTCSRQSPARTITVFIGTVDDIEDRRQPVLFEGRKLADRVYSQGNERICETLYESKDRLLIHIQTLYRVEGLRTEYELRESSEHELRTEFPELSRLRSPLGLEEALR
jgi:hypothetical protein